MEKYPTPGTYSSHHLPKREILSADELAKKTLELSQSDPIRTLMSSTSRSAKLYLVGGTLRDIASGLSGIDIDLASVLTPEQLEVELRAANIRVIETGIQHGTITALVGDIPVEITTFRKPGTRESNEYSDTIEEDLSGRDFTINAMAVCLSSNHFVDPFNGLSDLQNNIVRAVHDPEQRFREDPLRMLRMVRFGTAQGRTIDTDTYKAAQKVSHEITKVSIERIRDEFVKIVMSDCPAAGVDDLRKLELLEHILPELIPSIGFEQNMYHIHDVYEHTLWVLDRSPKKMLLRLASLFHDMGKPASLSIGDNGMRHFYKHEIISEELCKTAMERLKFSKNDTRSVSTLVRNHMRPLDCGDAGLRRIMRDLDDLMEDWLELKTADSPPKMPEEEFSLMKADFVSRLNAEKARLSNSYKDKLVINGDDLIELGFQEGRELGETITYLQELVIEDPSCNTEAQLLEEAKKRLIQSSNS